MSSRRPLLLVAAVVVLLVAALAVVAGLRLARDGGAGDPRPDQATPGTVLLVPGYGGNRRVLAGLADRLAATGRTARVLTMPGSGTGDFAVQAGVLDEAVRAALAEGAPSVDIVGFSAGGVVARLWVEDHAGAEVARRIVTLGSPLHGTRIAALGAAFASGSCPAACRQLAPDSELLERLAGEDLPGELPWLSIWTEDDETVQPPDSARLDGAINVPVQDVCPGARVSHGELPADPAVMALVVDALGPDPLTAPTSCPTG